MMKWNEDPTFLWCGCSHDRSWFCELCILRIDVVQLTLSLFHTISYVQYILVVWHPISHMYSIFSLSDILLVKCTVYSVCLTSYWSNVQYILVVWHPIGQMYRLWAGPTTGHASIFTPRGMTYWAQSAQGKGPAIRRRREYQGHPWHALWQLARLHLSSRGINRGSMGSFFLFFSGV
jgi:hypothetical protein